MDIEAYKEAIRKANLTHKDVINSIKITYAYSNNPVEKGDVVELLGNRVLVDTIEVYCPYNKDIPACRYIGAKLRKDLVPFKDGSRDSVYQHEKMTLIKAGDL